LEDELKKKTDLADDDRESRIVVDKKNGEPAPRGLQSAGELINRLRKLTRVFAGFPPLSGRNLGGWNARP
jgi:hypothetical protein